MYKIYLDVYLEESSDNQLKEKEENNYKDIFKLVELIRKEYIEKIKNDKLDIIAEQIRLEHSIGRYSTPFINGSTSLFIAITVSITSLFFQSLGVFNNIDIKGLPTYISEPLSLLLKIITFTLLISYTVKLLDDNFSRKNRNTSVINNVRLKVLKECIKDTKNIDEVAVTLDSEDELYIVLENTKQIKEFLGIK